MANTTTIKTDKNGQYNKTTIKTDINGQLDYHQDRQQCPIRLPSGPSKMANKTSIKTDKNGQ